MQNNYNIDTLRERQRWGLTQKIDHTIGAIEMFINRTGREPYVSFSGGKDSTVLLHICRHFINPKMLAVFCNTGNEYPEIVRFVKSVPDVQIITPSVNIRDMISKYGFPLISKEVAQRIRKLKTTRSEKLRSQLLYGSQGTRNPRLGILPYKWRYLAEQPFMVSEQCCDILKKRPFAKYQRLTGRVPIIATMAEESKLREQQWIIRGGCNSFKDTHLASYPLSIWTEADIWAYIKKFNVTICEIYNDPNCKRTGCMFCGFGVHLEKHSRFDMIWRLHPNLYKAVMNYTNGGVTYRKALRMVGVHLPDENPQLKINF